MGVVERIKKQAKTRRQHLKIPNLAKISYLDYLKPFQNSTEKDNEFI